MRPAPDDIGLFVRRRRWFHVQAVALGAAAVLLGVAIGLEEQRMVAAAGAALVLAAVAAVRCRRTIVSFRPMWEGVEGDDPWGMDGRPLTWDEAIPVVFVFATGLGMTILGAMERLDLLGR